MNTLKIFSILTLTLLSACQLQTPPSSTDSDALQTNADNSTQTDSNSQTDNISPSDTTSEVNGSTSQSEATTPDFFDNCSPTTHDNETYEPNNSLCQAYQFNFDSNDWISASLSPNDYNDYYAYKVQANHSYTLETIQISGDYGSPKNLEVRILNEEEAELLTPQYTDFPLKTFTLTSQTTGWIFINLFSSGPSSHIFKLRFLKSTDDGLTHDNTTYEPNNTKYTAYPATLNQSYTSSINASDPVDTYVLPVTNGQKLTLQLQDLGGSSGYYYWKVYDENDVVYQTDMRIYNGSSTKSLSLDIVASKKLYIKVFDYGTAESHRYTLYVN